ncbi:unannotated protein [freshwater metagenome]|uniref:Unannotated protein n=1 Tax=freshwater metagenome TaxID=449393 RepID=A0A6J7FWA1_9ZZZZ|nr:hypothetical protein [Actinomycetota bacterium]
MAPSRPPRAESSAVLPLKRQVWEDARVAEAAWSRALATHRDAKPASRGLRVRLRATSAAAAEMAAVAREAEAAGLAWAVLGPSHGSVDALPGELAAPNRWPCAEWAAVERAERGAVTVARAGTLGEVAEVFDVLAGALARLADVAGKPDELGADVPARGANT